jgi:hypothetical protein
MVPQARAALGKALQNIPSPAAASPKNGSQFVVSIGGNGVQPVISKCPLK